jgi:hypothetical protein
MSAALIDLRVVERLLGTRLSDQLAGSVHLRLPTDPALEDLSQSYIQFGGCDWVGLPRQGTSDESDHASLTAEFLCVAVSSDGRGDAYQAATLAAQVCKAMREVTLTGSDHRVEITGWNARRVVDENAPPETRMMIVTLTGRCERSSGTSTE